ncbi:MAG: hypothetical protein NZL91_03895 [Thermoflexales bacterium]|nr:hypothetical protein [Thermoflexales bacterium]MCS7324746.1 hypothetical protein [Thermoflexales bacterium]MCX7939648.1 hypothetical protein [Thermoflexales bacterium]MDW8053070.1 hypothetical protein [Anaerolineae bacterium]MDW8291723.1 hypothetical protein [Anaerolineae bacterium]
MNQLPKKLTFEEAWQSITIFFVDDQLEQEIENKVNRLLSLAEETNLTTADLRSTDELLKLLRAEKGLEMLLREIGLSEEKFMRIVSVLRQVGRVTERLDSEWNMAQIKRRLKDDTNFAQVVARLLLEGNCDTELRPLIPAYYLEMLNLAARLKDSREVRKVRYKQSLIGTYSGRKGYYVESRIKQRIQSLGVPYEQGRSPLVLVNVDFAIPSLSDPKILIMCSFQETTSSGQSTKARDMLTAYNRLREANSRDRTSRVFVNFADGGGWLARKQDYKRLVENCDYFVNLKHLDLIQEIIKAHFRSTS